VACKLFGLDAHCTANDIELASRKPSNRPPPLDPLSEDFLKKKQSSSLPPSTPVAGDLASSSIFNESEPAAQKAGNTAGQGTPCGCFTDSGCVRSAAAGTAAMGAEDGRASDTQAGRIDKATLLTRTERQHLSKSHLLDTSVKKLMPLARQISGKPIDEAIVQMRFSRKKVAQDVLKHLEYARNEAIVAKGMGLGKANDQPTEKHEFIDKKGKRRSVEDASAMYVDQAWVGRGFYGIGYDYRARGRVNLLRPPHASKFFFQHLWKAKQLTKEGITVLLKEEATRVREARSARRRRRRRSHGCTILTGPLLRSGSTCFGRPVFLDLTTI